ncbi:hypothetical protein MNBD_IGNAVI01-2423 [hydrothermal vent metagenome]|uniref:Uncharacterized protein n=1 Tax=hydrothermal vent metagenome TaxID=652676 RepID=A0A3B1CX37_9ZZZZ
MTNKIFLLFTNPFILSLVLSVILILSLPPFFDKYNIDEVKKIKTNESALINYCDLNSDGFSEEITIISSFKNRVGIIVREQNAVLNQWGFDGVLLRPENPIYCDINGDGLKEIAVFSLHENKILLNCFNPFSEEILIKDKVIDYFYPRNGQSSCSIRFCASVDANNDEINELYFSLSVGYPLKPRKIYMMDFKNDKLLASPEACIPINDPFSFRSNNEGDFYISTSTTAVGNCDSSAAFTDHFSWLMVLDKDLRFQFEPIKLGFYPSNLLIKPIRIEDQTFLAALNIYEGSKDHNCSISLINSEGKLEKEKNFDFSNDWYAAKLINKNNEFNELFIIRKDGLIEEVDENLNRKVIQQLLPFDESGARLNMLDIDMDVEDEFIFYHSDLEKVTITRNDFSNPLIFNAPGNNDLMYSTTILNGGNEPQLYLAFDNLAYYLNYYQNPLHNIKYLIYAGIYLGFYFLVFFIQKAQRLRTEHKYETEKKIAELQMKSIKNQIDPHFTLNIINSIGSLFAKQDTEKANYIFGKYSKLLRSTILSSENITSTLQEEIEYVENYIALEQYRFPDGFDYIIEKEVSINDKIKIPKMLIHSFVENAIKHGLKHLNKKGKLFIGVKNGSDKYKIVIRDNGVGRKKAKELAVFDTGRGLSIIDQILDLYYSFEKIKITYEMIDLTNEKNEAAGTEVIIKIPILKS